MVTEPGGSEPGGSRGVLVVGMHRSGTSAVTRILNLLGLPLCDASDLMPHQNGNPTGHWESQTLMWFNERLLAEIGGRWNLLPDVDGPVAAWHSLARHAPEARRTFLRLHPTPAWVWKDPRLCALLSFWRTVLACDPPVVLVLRHPLEISASLASRDQVPQADALRLWQHSLRHALLGCAGAPLYVIHYPRLLADPLAVCHGLTRFLQHLGLPVRHNDDAVIRFLDPQLRHATFHARDSAALSPAQRELLDVLGSLDGPYQRFDPPQEIRVRAPAAGPVNVPDQWSAWFAEAAGRGCDVEEIVTAAIRAGLPPEQVSAAIAEVGLGAGLRYP